MHFSDAVAVVEELKVRGVVGEEEGSQERGKA